MDKNKFWLGGRLFNTASRHGRKVVAEHPTQRKATATSQTHKAVHKGGQGAQGKQGSCKRAPKQARPLARRQGKHEES
jgi:hypothetical protein